jgi:hypothetical protein
MATISESSFLALNRAASRSGTTTGALMALEIMAKTALTKRVPINALFVPTPQQFIRDHDSSWNPVPYRIAANLQALFLGISRDDPPCAILGPLGEQLHADLISVYGASGQTLPYLPELDDLAELYRQGIAIDAPIEPRQYLALSSAQIQSGLYRTILRRTDAGQRVGIIAGTIAHDPVEYLRAAPGAMCFASLLLTATYPIRYHELAYEGFEVDSILRQTMASSALRSCFKTLGVQSEQAPLIEMSVGESRQ